MKKLKIIFIITGVLVHFNSHCQNDSIIKSGLVTIATLIVDFESDNFEGGNISYYSCADCAADSIPFTIIHNAPGEFGVITFKLLSYQSTVFNATIFWGGSGQIYYPDEISILSPFINGGSAINKPDDLRYMRWDGTAMDSISTSDSYRINKAALAWDEINQLSITNQFAEKGFKSAIYLYQPNVGFLYPGAKWVIFLYHNDVINSINTNKEGKNTVTCYPKSS